MDKTYRLMQIFSQSGRCNCVPRRPRPHFSAVQQQLKLNGTEQPNHSLQEQFKH